jgi:hypothetical protein
MKGARWKILALLVLLALGTTVGLERTRLRVAFVVWRIRHSPPEELDARIAALKGEENRAVLEALAFSPESADETTRPLRQRAFDELLRIRELTDGELRRCIPETRGLDRAWVAETFDDHEGADLRDAAIEALGERDGVALPACRYLFIHHHPKDHETLLAFRGAVWSAPIVAVRIFTCRILGMEKDPENAPALRRALADGDSTVRLWAAEILAVVYDDPAGAQTAVNALDGHHEWAKAILGALHERRAVLALARFHDANRDSTMALESITGTEPPRGASWTEWFEAHRAEFPPQLERQVQRP